MSDSPPDQIVGAPKRVRLLLSTPPGMPPGSSRVKVTMSAVKVRVGGLAPLLMPSAPGHFGKEETAPRPDEVYRGQINVMRREVEKLTMDNKLLRASHDIDVSTLKDLRESKRRLDLQLHEQSKAIDLTSTYIEGERRAADSEWGELVDELKKRLYHIQEDLQKYKRHGARAARLSRQLEAQTATLANVEEDRDKAVKEVARLRSILRTRDNRIEALQSRAQARRFEEVRKNSEASETGKIEATAANNKKEQEEAKRKAAEQETARLEDEKAEWEAVTARELKRVEMAESEARVAEREAKAAVAQADKDMAEMERLRNIEVKARTRQSKTLELVRDALKLSKDLQPPKETDWEAANTNYRYKIRKQQVDYLLKVLKLRKWRTNDLVTALENAGYTQDVFDSSPFWTMRMAWLRHVLKQLQENFWNADLAVKLKVGGNISEPRMDELRAGTCYDAIDKETGKPRRAVLVRHAHRPAQDLIYVPTPIVSRWRWVPQYHSMRNALGMTLSEDGELCTRSFLPELINLVRSDLDLGLLDASYLIVDSVIVKKVIVMLMADGFPLNTQSIEHMCIGSGSTSKGLNQSEAGLITLAVGRMAEKNSTMHVLFKQAGVDTGDAELRSNPIITIDDSRCCAVEVLGGADKKGVEVNRGCGNCCPWCMCGIGMIHVRPWPAGFRPPSFADAKKRLLAAGCQGIASEELILEAAHEPLDGEELPQSCRFCAATPSKPWYMIEKRQAKRPYSTPAALAADQAAAKKSAADTSKEGIRTHALNRRTHAEKHGHQHKFCRPTLKGGMKRWVPELLHALPLNAGRQVFKQKSLRMCDAFAREQGTLFFAGIGAPINLAKKETGRQKAERWFKGSTWDELVRGGGAVAPGGMAPWVSSFALLIADCHEDARKGGGKHSSAPLHPPSVFAPAAPARRVGGCDIESDSDDEPPRCAPVRPPPQAPQAEKPDDELSLDELAVRRYGKSLASQLISMVDGYDLYKKMHVTLMEPPATETDAQKECFALDVAVAVNDTFHNVEESSTLGNPHKSYTWHELGFIVPLFVAERGDLWKFATTRLESRGARAKVVARSVVCWSKAPLRHRAINKRERHSGKRALRGGPERTGRAFTQTYTGSGALQLLGAQGLREKLLRRGLIAAKKSHRLAKLGRVTAPRQTQKWHELDLSAVRNLSCRKAFELCLRGKIPRFYDVQGRKGDWSAVVELLACEAARGGSGGT